MLTTIKDGSEFQNMPMLDFAKDGRERTASAAARPLIEALMINHILINGITFALPDFPANSRILLTIAGDALLSATPLKHDEHVATMMAFLEIAEKSGFDIQLRKK